MKFEVHKVVDSVRGADKHLHTKVFYSDNLVDLENYVTGKVPQDPALLEDIDDTTFPFVVENALGETDVWRYIYPCDNNYRPFESVRELVILWDSMVMCKRPSKTMPLIWVKYKESGTIQMITAFADTGVEMGATFMSWVYLFEKMIFLDGTPCGVKIN